MEISTALPAPSPAAAGSRGLARALGSGSAVPPPPERVTARAGSVPLSPSVVLASLAGPVPQGQARSDPGTRGLVVDVGSS